MHAYSGANEVLENMIHCTGLLRNNLGMNKHGTRLLRRLIEVRDSPNGIFGSWARWNRASPDVQSCWETVAVAWKLRSTFRPGNFNKTFS